MSQTFGIITIQPGSLLGEGELEAITGDFVRARENLGGERWTSCARRWATTS